MNEQITHRCIYCGEDKDIVEFYRRVDYQALENRCKKCHRSQWRRCKFLNPRAYMLKQAKKRAKKEGIPCDLMEEDIPIPKYCPVFPWIALQFAEHRSTNNSPSLDKVIPERGYVKGNVRVISNKANRLKCNCSLYELELLVKYVKENS